MKYIIALVILTVALFGSYFFNIFSVQSNGSSGSYTQRSSSFGTVNGSTGSKTSNIAGGIANEQKRDLVGSNQSASLGNELFEQYKRGGRTGLAAKIMLDEIAARGIDKTTSNFKLVSDLLKSNKSNEEKVGLVRILADFYSKDDSNGMNGRVLDDLRQISQSADRELARAATFSFSRLGNFTDTENILLTAKNSNFISEKEYYVELSYSLPGAPSGNQKAIADTIRSGGNAFAAEIFSAMLLNKDAVKNISPDALNVVKLFIGEHEPVFPGAPGEFGLFNAVVYGEWITAIAVINGGENGQNTNKVLLERLGDRNTDPRKIISFLISTGADQFISGVGSNDVFQQMLRKIDTFAAANQSNGTLQEAVSSIHKKVKKTG